MLNGLIKHHSDPVSKIFSEMNADNNKTLTHFLKLVTSEANTYDSLFLDSNKLKGDLFEILSAFIFNSNPTNVEFGLIDFKLLGGYDDYGVDGVGINPNGELSVVQCKYKTNITDEVTYTDLTKTFTDGVLFREINPIKHNNIYIITTGIVNYVAKSRLKKHLVIIDCKKLKSIINGNSSFWNYCKTYIDNVLQKA